NKFNAYSELWAKSLRVKEEGTRLHPLAVRHAHQSAMLETGGTNGPHGAVEPRSPARGKPAAAPAASWRIPTDRRDDATLKNLYDSFIAAKDRAGDQKRPTFEAFAREIARHTAALKGKADCDAIDFKIDCKDNKVSIKAKPTR
ncbi:MAG TPA: MXAN_5187 C-terminal domain-containing protein, partial [Candidatus Polarisedimenticolia bacterium]|nr:MXAN_5187 C-terminal domain-containing protein [Candidatus Polarisedimenticolia bacterium]